MGGQRQPADSSRPRPTRWASLALTGAYVTWALTSCHEVVRFAPAADGQTAREGGVVADGGGGSACIDDGDLVCPPSCVGGSGDGDCDALPDSVDPDPAQCNPTLGLHDSGTLPLETWDGSFTSLEGGALGINGPASLRLRRSLCDPINPGFYVRFSLPAEAPSFATASVRATTPTAADPVQRVCELDGRTDLCALHVAGPRACQPIETELLSGREYGLLLVASATRTRCAIVGENGEKRAEASAGSNVAIVPAKTTLSVVVNGGSKLDLIEAMTFTH